LYDPDAGFAWYTGSGILITQVCAERGTAPVATILSNWIDETLASHREEIAQSGGLFAVHDWRQVRRYDSAARSVWFERMKKRPKGYLRKAIVIIADNPLLKMAVAGGNLLAAISLDGHTKVELASDIHAVMRQHSLMPPK
jgi:hypothetical protein